MSRRQRLSNKALSWLGLTLSRRQPGGLCPSAEEIVAWHDRALKPFSRRRIEAHVAHCDACHASWMSLIAFDEDAVVRAPARQRSTFGRWLARPVYAMAAVVIVSSGLLTVTVMQHQGTANQIPGYGITLQAGAQFRGANTPNGTIDGTVAYQANHAFELILTPDIPTDEDLEIKLYAQRGAVIDEIALPEVTISSSGAVLVEGHVGRDVILPGGQSRLLIVIGIAGKLPSSKALARQLRDSDYARKRRWSAWAVHVQYTE